MKDSWNTRRNRKKLVVRKNTVEKEENASLKEVMCTTELVHKYSAFFEFLECLEQKNSKD